MTAPHSLSVPCVCGHKNELVCSQDLARFTWNKYGEKENWPPGWIIGALVCSSRSAGGSAVSTSKVLISWLNLVQKTWPKSNKKNDPKLQGIKRTKGNLLRLFAPRKLKLFMCTNISCVHNQRPTRFHFDLILMQLSLDRTKKWKTEARTNSWKAC